MIDVHCHLLPGIDDGARDLDEALALCRLAVANGITHSVVTPHIHPGRWDNDRHTIEAAHALLTDALSREGVALEVGIASEVRISPEVLQMLPQSRIPFLGHWGDGRKVMLLELPHSHVPPGSDKLVEWMMRQDILPMIAHPERNKDVMRDFDKLVPFVEVGCLLQVTAGSVAGSFGEPARETAVRILERGWVTLLASDAHNEKHRPPDLRPGVAAAARIVGEAHALELVTDRPWGIVQRQFASTANAGSL